jgi:hypothetical protein
MRWIGTATIVVGLALSTLFGAGLAGASESASARAKFVKCGKYSLGFTDAKVKSRGMKCAAAKGVFNKWRRKVDCPDGPCERTRVENFVCRFGGTDVTVRLRCEHRTRDRAMKARWGG